MRGVILSYVSLMALSGCASSDLSIRSLPPDTPAAANAAAVENAAVLAAVETGAAHRASEEDNSQALIPLTTGDAPSMYSYDPWERMNRFTYRFNARFDEAVFLPVANGYRRVPSPIRSGVHNFFDNLAEVKSIVSYALQLSPRIGARSVGRFLINSTLGIGGLFDVAARFNLESEPTGLSATFSKWGLHPGPYLVIPLLGPSTLRDGVGFLGDFGVAYAVNVADLWRGGKSWTLDVVNAVDQRSNISFRYYATGSPFEYETVRFLYVHRELIEDAALHAKDRPKASVAGVPAGR
jgi:phospholipid-binding lipoprotein MlaA